MGIGARLLPLGLVLLAATGQGKDKSIFTQEVSGVDVDWTTGTLTAQAGAGADMRMPNPNAARPGAERRARAQAEGKLAAALRTMVSGKQLDIESVVKRATVVRTEYQSDGGVFLWLGLGFAQIAPARDAPRALKIASMPFAFAPTLASGGRESPLAFATYRPASECPKDAVGIKRDRKGRIELVAGDAKLLDFFAGAAVVIYLEQAQP